MDYFLKNTLFNPLIAFLPHKGFFLTMTKAKCYHSIT